ncbi:hypothetical protein TRFO_03260 [Tritrichomonas foetus]|uniref:Uncharacterized protein n=1 Tax=Tritrichomonas foetus TaxID=1144522 RepID=A0A1J4KR00_9EUKA|nr:hypothetical protein TRFO_03260 [Tritrichomonas foetus]|eukprot:OHT13530.1 hypothetical protein TRFO_03260 [Tritrichomonas foetus]
MATNPSKKQVPRTAEEANAFMEAAIEAGDFELAKEYNEQVDLLKNFHEELHLAGTVHSYFENKQALSNNMGANYVAYKKQIEEGKKKSDMFFQTEFQYLKEKQEAELDALLDKWDATRNTASEHAEAEYNQMMTTARLIAQQKKFDEAINIRNLAGQKLKSRSKQRIKELDAQFRKQCDLLLQRQQQEINALAGRRLAESRLFDALAEAAESEALDVFLVNNASAVIGIANRFRPDSFIPKSLSMQTVRSRPSAPKQTKKMNAEKTYLKRMDNVDKTLSTPLRNAPGKKATSKFSPTREVMSKSENEINDSLSLTRSQLSSGISSKY